MSREEERPFQLAQNFLHSPELVRGLVKSSSIGPGDTVYEIGPGRGIITGELAKVAAEVIAIEIDPHLAIELSHKFRDIKNVRIIRADFLEQPVRHGEYKLFSNIPFNATAAIVRKVLYSDSSPSDAYLVMQREAAGRFGGFPTETQTSVLAKPNWSMEMVHAFNRKDFDPPPSVDVCLLRFKRRETPIIERSKRGQYAAFVRYGFGRWKQNLKLTFKPVFTYAQWKRLAGDLGFAIDAKPTDLSFEQWCKLFKGFEVLVSEWKKERVYAWRR